MKISEIIETLTQMMSLGGGDTDSNIDSVELRMSTKTTHERFGYEPKRQLSYYVHFDDSSKRQALEAQQMMLEAKMQSFQDIHDIKTTKSP